MRLLLDTHALIWFLEDAPSLGAAAQELGCEAVFSEDLNDGQNYDGVRVENPFRDLS